MLFYCRLGHPSFSVIKIIFSYLFYGFNVESFHREVCEIAKHKCVPFPLNDTKSTSLFNLSHIDVWGPSNIPNVSGV